MKLKVHSTSGKATSKSVELNDAIFGIEPNDHAIYLDVKQFLANQRQGTHDSKERAEITGSTRKIKRQKGTGTARAGSIKSPVFRGGGRVFGPEPRDYSFKLNKKVKQLARKSALSYKAKNEKIIVLDELTMDAPKTKAMNEVIGNLKVTDRKSLWVLADLNKNVYLSARNLEGVKVVDASELSTYDIMNAGSLVLTAGALEKIEAVLS